MKRSRSIKLVLIGGLSVGLTGCDSRTLPPPVSAEAAYTNNYFVPGVGYYHAPFRAWYQLPYNHYDPNSQRYFYGGQWAATPCVSITNISSPPAQIAQHVEARRTDLPPPSTRRGGFGSSSIHRSTWS